MFWTTRGSRSTSLNIDAIAEVALNAEKACVYFGGRNGEGWYSSHKTVAGAAAEYREFVAFANGETSMSSVFTISIPERMWEAMDDYPHDGTVVFLRDAAGNVDIGEMDRGEWNMELGNVSIPIWFARLSIVTGPDIGGKCGRCGRVRGGP